MHNASRLVRGVSDQRLQTRGGERWPGKASVGDAALPPAVQAASSGPALPRVTWPHWRRSSGTVRSAGLPSGPAAVERRSPGKEGGLPETVSPPGAMRSKPHKHRARDALGFGGLAALHDSTSLDVARRRGPVGPQDPWRSARPRFFSGREKYKRRRTRRRKETGR